MEGAYFLNASVLYSIATEAYNRIRIEKSSTDLANRSRAMHDVMISLLFSAATLEALIMELALNAEVDSQQGHQTELPQHQLAPILKEAENSYCSVRLKYLLTKSILSGKPYDKGRQPYQDFELLFSIRDTIVHMKPERIGKEPHKIVQALSSKGLCDREKKGIRAPWIFQIATKSVARWACNVVCDMVDSLKEHFPDDENSTFRPNVMTAMLLRNYEQVE